jgi:tRNA (mo5U34)-methyltransferase
MLGTASASEAAAFIAASGLLWHQKFELAPGLATPGVNDLAFLLDRAGVPADLTGLSVLDVGTTNGGGAFEAERRGARRVVAVDIVSADHFGFRAIRHFLGSRVEFVQASVYELPERLDETFDLVLFFGVLYHLRHPLLALDRLWEVTRGDIAIETAVCDHDLAMIGEAPYARFYRRDELANDGSNWFAPSSRTLADWVGSSGFDVRRTDTWPAAAPQRAMVTAARLPAPQEYLTLSYERPLAVHCR